MKWRLLEGVPETDVQRLLSIARRRRFGRGEVVFHEQDPADTVHLVQKGRVAVRVSTALGDAAILAVLGPGDIFGELALLSDDSRRTATVAALEPAETFSVHKLDFDRLRREHPETAEVLIAILYGQVRRLSRHLVDALYVPAERRVLRRLAEVAEVYAADDGDAAETVIPLTQEELGELAGTSRATVNRVLREEEERGTVELRRGRTIVRDLETLQVRGGR